VVTKTIVHAREFGSLAARESAVDVCKKSLFHRNFCNVDNGRAMRRRAFVQRCIKQTARAVNASTPSKCAPRTRFVKPDTVFFVVL